MAQVLTHFRRLKNDIDAKDATVALLGEKRQLVQKVAALTSDLEGVRAELILARSGQYRHYL